MPKEPQNIMEDGEVIQPQGENRRTTRGGGFLSSIFSTNEDDKLFAKRVVSVIVIFFTVLVESFVIASAVGIDIRELAFSSDWRGLYWSIIIGTFVLFAIAWLDNKMKWRPIETSWKWTIIIAFLLIPASVTLGFTPSLRSVINDMFPNKDIRFVKGDTAVYDKIDCSEDDKACKEAEKRAGFRFEFVWNAMADGPVKKIEEKVDPVSKETMFKVIFPKSDGGFINSARPVWVEKRLVYPADTHKMADADLALARKRSIREYGPGVYRIKASPLTGWVKVPADCRYEITTPGVSVQGTYPNTEVLSVNERHKWPGPGQAFRIKAATGVGEIELLVEQSS